MRKNEQNTHFHVRKELRLLLKTSLRLGVPLWLGIIVSCHILAPYPVSQISFTGLCGITPEQFKEINQEQVRQWLEKQYGATVKISEEGEDTVSLYAEEWSRGSGEAYVRQGHLIEITREVKNGPSLGQIVEIFGIPESVYGNSMVLEKIPYSVGLDYPKLGISVLMRKIADASEVVHENRLQVQLKRNYLVNVVHCYEPRASMGEVLRSRHLLSKTAVVEEALRQRRPWAGFDVWVPLQ